MNTFSKYAPNVFLAKCEKEHDKGNEIVLTTRHGKEVEVEVVNFIYEKDGFFYYSFIRTDGLDSQERAKRKAERYQGYQNNAYRRANEWREKALEGVEFLSLGEPIKVGHHSEKRHRALIERNNNRMRHRFEEIDKAESYTERIAYWESQAEKIDLSMPESLDYYEAKYEQAKERHQFLKENPDKREHAYSLAYANKTVKDLKEKYELAVRLWSD